MSFSLFNNTSLRLLGGLWLVLLPLLGWGQSTTIVISQVYGGGGNSGSPYTNDFIELHNVSNIEQSVAGFSVQYASNTGTSWSTTSLSGAIPAGGYYLIQEAAGNTAAAGLPTPDATGTLALSNTAGKIALVSSRTALSGNCNTILNNNNVIDLVGFGTSTTCFEGNGNTGVNLTNTTAALRSNNGCTDTNHNETDFTAGAPAPRNLASQAYSCSATGTLTATPTAAFTAFTTQQGTPSAAQSYTLAGTGVPASGVTVTPPAGYEVSQTSATAGFGGDATAITVAQADVSATGGKVIYVRLSGTTAGIYGTSAAPLNVGNASTGANTANVPVYGNTTAITVTPASLSGFGTTQGTASVAQSYTLTGTGLTAGVTVTPPAGYQVSQTSATTGFAAQATALTVSQTNAAAGRTIYVRLAGTTAGTYSGNITNASTGAATQSVALSGTVAAPAPRLTASPTALTGFSYVVGSGPSASQSFSLSGSNLTAGDLTVTGSTSYDVSGDNATFGNVATIANAAGGTLSTPIYVRLKAGLAVGSYGGETITVAGGGVTSSPSVTASGSVAPLAPTISSFTPASGLVGTSVTINGANFSSASTVSFNGTAATAVAFVTDVQLTATVPTGATTGPIAVTTAGGTATSATSFTVLVPVVEVTPSSLTGFSTTTGVASAPQTYQVSGNTLDGTSLAIASTNPSFAVSLDGISYAATASIALNGSATLAATTVYVRLTSTASTGALTTTIANSNGATTTPVTASGAVLATTVAKRWTGAANTTSWFDAANWESGTVPTSGDDVVLDHHTVAGKYTVTLSGTTAVTVSSLRIRTGTGDSIVFLVPATNTLTAAFKLTRATAGDTALAISNKGALVNRSGASSGDPVDVVGASPTAFLLNGGSYYHRVARGNSAVVENLSGAAGTETGNFFFRVPGSSQYSIAASGRTYGNLILEAGLVPTYATSGSSALTINGNLIIQRGITFSSTLTASLILKGNLVNNGDFILNPSASGTNTRRLVLSGTAPQTISGTALGTPGTASSYLGTNQQLEINNPAGVTLQTPVLLSNALTLTSGVLTTDATNVLTMAATASVAGGTNASFVSGPLARVAAGTGASTVLFPLGRGTAYRPLTLTIAAQSATTTYTALQTEGRPADQDLSPNDLTRISKIRYFSVTPTVAPATFSGTITLSFGGDDGVTDPGLSSFVVGKSDGSGWVNIGQSATSGTASAGTLTSGTFTGFSNFILASTLASTATNAGVNPLPVQLTSLTAARATGGVQVAWATASEVNSAKFVVERSLDGYAYLPVASVAAQGSTQLAHRYASLDRAAPAGRLYYRLRQVDLDGTAHYSPAVAVAGALAEFTLAPNPTRATVSFFTETPTAYTVRNTLGQVVRTGTTLAGANTLAVEALPAGVYLFELRTDTGRVVRRFIKE
jgi:hypothetical protein